MSLFYPIHVSIPLKVSWSKTIQTFALCSFVFISACTKSTDDSLLLAPPDVKDYIMTDVGQYCIFTCTQTSYSIGEQASTETFLEKHELLKVSLDGNFRVVGITRKSSADDLWVEVEQKLMVHENHKILEIQSNQTLCILVNPIEVGTSWNLNLFNHNKAQKSQILRYEPQEIYANRAFSKLLEIELYKDSSALGIRKKQIRMIPKFGIVRNLPY